MRAAGLEPAAVATAGMSPRPVPTAVAVRLLYSALLLRLARLNRHRFRLPFGFAASSARISDTGTRSTRHSLTAELWRSRLVRFHRVRVEGETFACRATRDGAIPFWRQRRAKRW